MHPTHHVSMSRVSVCVFFSDDEDEKPAKKELKPGAAKGFLKKEAGGDDDDDSDSEDWGSSDSVRLHALPPRLIHHVLSFISSTKFSCLATSDLLPKKTKLKRK